MREIFIAACRPATEGVLDPYTPHIEVPDGIPSRDSPAEDLPYYFGIIQAMEAAEVAPCPSSPSQIMCCRVLTPLAMQAQSAWSVISCFLWCSRSQNTSPVRCNAH